MKRGGRGGRGGMRGKNQPARHFEQRSFVPNEIQNINKELELLKQKKEMMQEQHSMLQFARYYEDQNYYGQAPYDTPAPSWSNRSYQDDQSFHTAADYIPLNRGKKRPLRHQPPGWPSSGQEGDTSAVAQMFGSRLGPKPARAQPRAAAKHPHAGRPEPAPKRAKPNFAPPAKKSPTFPSDGDLKMGGNVKHSAEETEAHTLRADREPSTALNGLLELGLGFMLKQIKSNYANSPQHKPMVTREYYLRRLKKMLRERIRSIMMDQYIPNYMFVVEQYRKKFPIQSDEELMKQVREGTKSEPVDNGQDCKPNLKAARASQTFFRKNIRNVAKTKLREMFHKIIEMYNSEVIVGQACEIEPKKEDNKPAAKEKKNKNQKPTKWNIDLEDVIEKRFLSRFKRYMPIINKILNQQPEFKKEQEELLAAAMVRDPTMPRAIKDNIKQQQQQEQEKQQQKQQATEVAAEPEILPYAATVKGYPKLPPQTLMRPFLNSFNPKKIKTHKKIKHLLIVKFEEKPDYDKFLLQNGVTVGDSVLEIKVSTILVNNPSTVPKTETCDIVDKKTDEQDPDESLLSSDIDSQINDLLSSIRQAEEEKEADGTIEREQEANTENSADVNESQNDDSQNTTEAPGDLEGQNNSLSNTNDKQDENTTQDDVEVNTANNSEVPSSANNEETKQSNDDKPN